MALENEETLPGENTARIRSFIVRIFPYLPLLIVFLAVGFVLAFTYLRYAHYVYETQARVILSIDQGQKQDDKSGILQLKLDNQTNSPEDRALELFQSKENMALVVKNLHLYAEIVSKGRFVSKPSFGLGSPLKIISPYPDSIQTETILDFKYDTIKNLVYFEKHYYPIGKLVKTPFGIFKFDFQKEFIKSNWDGDFLLHIKPVGSVTNDILGRLHLISKTKPSNIFEIYLQDEIPERAKAIIPEMIHVYDSLSAIKQRESNGNLIRFIDQRVKVVSDDLNAVEQELQNFKSKYKTENLSAEGSIFFAQSQQVSQEISQLLVQLKVMDDVEIYLNRTYQDPKSLPAMVDLNNPSITSQIFQLFDLESQLDKQKGISGQNNPQTIYLEDRIKSLKPAILESIQNQRRASLIILKNKQDNLQHYDQLLKEVPNKEKLLLEITRKQEAKNAIFTYLLQKKEEVSLNSASIFPKTQILEKPETTALVSPIASQVYLVFMAFSLAVAVGLIALVEGLDNTIKSRNDIDRIITAPIIGEISQIKDIDPIKPIVIGKSTKTIVAEQFRSLRTNLNYLGLDQNRKVILVTSSIMREGKSLLVLNISIALALSGKKVLLMDFDLRKPKITSQLSSLNAPGITNYLLGNVSLEEIIQNVPGYPNLFFIPSGPIPPNPSEIIMSKSMDVLIKSLLGDFDQIILDSPPVGIVTDAKLLTSFADLTLFVIRQGVTPTLFLRNIQNYHLEKVFPNMGVILNDLRIRRINSYGYGYEYAYESKEVKRFTWVPNWVKTVFNIR